MFRFILSFFTKKQTLDSSSNIISNIPSSRSIRRNVAANNPRTRAKAAIGRALFFARFSTDKSRLIRPIAEVTRENYHAGTNENYRGYPLPFPSVRSNRFFFHHRFHFFPEPSHRVSNLTAAESVK